MIFGNLDHTFQYSHFFLQVIYYANYYHLCGYHMFWVPLKVNDFTFIHRLLYVPAEVFTVTFDLV